MKRRDEFFVAAPRGTEDLLADELRRLGLHQLDKGRAGVAFQGALEDAYRVCLWSRIANRVVMPLASFAAPTPEALYEAVRDITWEDHLLAEGTLAVDFTSLDSQISHTRYGAQRVKDAVVDRFRERFGRRPSVDLAAPDLRINLFLKNDSATLGIDLSGGSLHRRGYRAAAGDAPLKENLAAAILALSGWPELAAAGAPLYDPVCGSGTFLIEGALMAADVAPGLQRRHFGFLGWRSHDQHAWERLLTEADERRREGERRMANRLVGYDIDLGTIKIARENAQLAGVGTLIEFVHQDFTRMLPPKGSQAGLIVANPPYGERLGQETVLASLYRSLGSHLRAHFGGWNLALLSASPLLLNALGVGAEKEKKLFNGPIEVTLQHGRIPSSQVSGSMGPPVVTSSLSPSAQMFANRLRKNRKRLASWVRRENVECYRLYDADLPEYAVSVDLYGKWVHVQEYLAPRSVDADKAEQRRQEVLAVLPGVLDVPAQNIFFKVRQRQKGALQYQKVDAREVFAEVREGPGRFLVNLSDYLDTGLFLDHRLTRKMILDEAEGRHFLNLFGYTGTATVYAALGGALTTTTVDLSSNYLEWARRNLEINGLDAQRNRLVRADCLRWLEIEKKRYDLIFLDPPTFSSSKRMDGVLDIQRDHPRLVKLCVQRLNPGGLLIFSNNNRRFQLERQALKGLHIEDISRATLPRDFDRNPRIHNCWRICPDHVESRKK